MDKTTLLAVVFALAAVLPGGAQAQIEVHVSGTSAGTLVDHVSPAKPETGYAFEPQRAPNDPLPEAVDIDLGLLRLEGEAMVYDDSANRFALTPNGLYGGSNLRTTAGMANAFIDFPISKGVSPFVGGGIGYANVSAQGYKAFGSGPLDDQDVVMAYQLRAGFAVSLFSATEVVLGYRLFVTKDLALTGASGDPVAIDNNASHIGELGFRTRF